MATTQHSTITDPNIHEPKGCSTAVSGSSYVSTGTGTGSWSKIQKAIFGHIKGTGSTTTTLITTAFKAINTTNIGSNLTWAETANYGVTTSTTGYIETDTAGTYQIIAGITFTPQTASSTFQFTIGVDTGGGIVSKEATILQVANTTTTTDTAHVSLNCVYTCSADAKVYLMVKETASGNEVIFNRIEFTASYLGT